MPHMLPWEGWMFAKSNFIIRLLEIVEQVKGQKFLGWGI
jgi:hypothetical protein